MAADPVIYRAFYRSKTEAELVEAEGTISDAILNPSRITGNQLEGVSWQFSPRSLAECRQELENIEAALALHRGESPKQQTISRYIDRSKRCLE